MKTRKKQKIAVFDVDGTLFRSSLLIELVDGLIAQGIFPKTAARIYEREYERWLNRDDSYDKYIWKVVEAYQKHIKGVRESDVHDVAEHVMRFHQKRLYRYTRDLLRKLQKTHYCVAISWSPVDIVGPFCKELGFDKVYGRVHEIDERGRFTGKVLFEEEINRKDVILKRVATRERLTLKGSVGVGDSESDVVFLKLVDNPIAFNPNTKLYQAAKRFGWKVVVERKDMVYMI